MEAINPLPKNLRILRKRNKLTQKEVAAKLFVSRTAYTHYETGRVPLPVDRLPLIASLYELPDITPLLTTDIAA